MRKFNDNKVVEKLDALRGLGARVLPARAFLTHTFDLCDYDLTLADLILMGYKCSIQRHSHGVIRSTAKVREIPSHDN